MDLDDDSPFLNQRMDEDVHCSICEREIDSPYHQYWSVETGEGVIVCEDCFQPPKPLTEPLDMVDMMDALEDVETEMKAEEALKEYTEDPNKRCQFCGLLASDSWWGDWFDDLYCTEECKDKDCVDGDL